jgi:hypothetical protein
MSVELEGRALHIIYCDADKRPMGWGHGWGDAVADPASIARLRTGPNIGVATGVINGIVVVDVDPRNGGDKTFAEALSWLPPTRTHRTKGGGQHLIYRYPLGISKFRKGRLPGIDILANGKGVVWPPSPGYSVIDARPPVDFPIAEWMVAQERKGAFSPNGESNSNESHTNGKRENAPSPSIVQPTRNLRLRTSRILAVVQNAKPGDERNEKLYWAARRFAELIAEGFVTRKIAEAVLLSAAWYNGHVAKRGLKQTEDTIASGLDHPLEEP